MGSNKNYVAIKNTTFKFGDMKDLFYEARSKITTEDWKKCTQHVIKVEDKFWQLDCTMENTIESFIKYVNDSDSNTTSSNSSTDSKLN